MSNAASRSQNNIKAGIFVTVSILVGLCVIFVLGDFIRYFGPSDSTYTVTYEVSDGVAGLGSGSFVKVGGIVVGKVDDVTFDVQENRPLTKIDVVFSMPVSMQLRTDAQVSVGAGLISSDAWLAFTSLGTEGAVIEPGGTFQGVSLSMLDSLLGSDSSDNISSTLDSLAVITKRLEQDGELIQWVLGDGSTKDVQEVLSGLNDAVKNGNKLLTDLDADWANWSKEIDVLMAEVQDFARAVDTLSSWINNNETKFQDITDNLDDTLSRASELATTIQEQTWPKVEAFIDNLLATTADVKVVVADLRARSGPWFGDIDVTLANLTLSSQQLTQLLAEVTASPWRLLYRPTDKQYSQELIYEASRNFVFGAADLKSAAESMQRFMDAHGQDLSDDHDQFELMRKNLLDSARRYQRAQEQLMGLLRGDEGGAGDSP
ncbi:MAG: hypothetical protein P8K80_11455 [Phycisphaerales bacterium]|nr:hypothetical protein [Phycisphaerales bacterium]